MSLNFPYISAILGCFLAYYYNIAEINTGVMMAVLSLAVQARPIMFVLNGAYTCKMELDYIL